MNLTEAGVGLDSVWAKQGITHSRVMPNWCENTLICFGAEDKLEELGRYAERGTALSFEKVLPNPMVNRAEELDWQIGNWGTKWDVSAELTRSENTWEYSFSSAWAPPWGVVRKLSQMHPEIVFYLAYSEPGVDAAGMVLLLNNVIIMEDDRSWSEDWDEENEVYDDSWCQFPAGIAQELVGLI